jgi:hypothetical protein
VIKIPKGSYIQVLRPRNETVEKEPGAPPASSQRYWPFAAAWQLLRCGIARLDRACDRSRLARIAPSPIEPRGELAESPIWAGFRFSNVVVAVGTPLFFRSTDGLERNFSANFPKDLALADQLLLAHRPAYPLWNEWAPFEDVAAPVKLDRFLRGLNSTVTVASARQISFGGLAGKRTIVIGQPRFAPLLVDLLAGQNFRPPAYIPGNISPGS